MCCRNPWRIQADDAGYSLRNLTVPHGIHRNIATVTMAYDKMFGIRIQLNPAQQMTFKSAGSVNPVGAAIVSAPNIAAEGNWAGQILPKIGS